MFEPFFSHPSESEPERMPAPVAQRITEPHPITVTRTIRPYNSACRFATSVNNSNGLSVGDRLGHRDVTALVGALSCGHRNI